MLRRVYHLHVFCYCVPKLKAVYDTVDEAEIAAVEHYRQYFPWDLVVEKWGFDKAVRMVEDGYIIRQVREDKLFLFATGEKPLDRPVEDYFKGRGDGDEDFKVLYDEEGFELESVD